MTSYSQDFSQVIGRPPLNSTLFGLMILLCITFALFKTIDSILRHRYHAHRAGELGCLPVQRVRHNRTPLGADNVYRLLAADRRKKLPQELYKIYLEQGNATGSGAVNTWMESKFGASYYVTVEPRNVQAILATQFYDFEVGDVRNRASKSLLGTGIFILDGKNWEHARALLRPQFARTLISDLELEERHFQNLIKQIHPHREGNEWTSVVDLRRLFFNLTLDTSTEFLFGDSLDSQLQKKDGSNRHRHGFDLKHVAEALDMGLHGLANRIRLGNQYWLYNPKSFRDATKLSHDFTDTYIRLLLEQNDSGGASKEHLDPQEENNKYVFLKELAKSTQDPKELRSQALAILMAGRDTTASLLSWAFWMLARHPIIYENLRKVIREDFGTYDAPVITFESLKGCKYLQHVINETNRLCTILPFNLRRAARDTSLPCGGGPDGKSPLYIKKGQEVQFHVGVMHIRTDIWGSDAKEFNPDRWIGRRPGFEFIPFLAGPRLCLGQQFALTEAAYVIVRLIQRYDIVESPDKSWVQSHDLTLTDAPSQLLVRFHEERLGK